MHPGDRWIQPVRLPPAACVRVYGSDGRMRLVVDKYKFGFQKYYRDGRSRYICTSRGCKCYLIGENDRVFDRVNDHNHPQRPLNDWSLSAAKRPATEVPLLGPAKLLRAEFGFPQMPPLRWKYPANPPPVDGPKTLHLPEIPSQAWHASPPLAVDGSRTLHLPEIPSQAWHASPPLAVDGSRTLHLPEIPRKPWHVPLPLAVDGSRALHLGVDDLSIDRSASRNSDSDQSGDLRYSPESPDPSPIEIEKKFPHPLGAVSTKIEPQTPPKCSRSASFLQGHQRVPSGSREFHEVTTKDAEIRLQQELDRLVQDAPECDRVACKKEMDGFAALFRRFLTEKKKGPSIEWEKIQKLPESTIRNYQSLATPSLEEAKKMLEKLVVIKLNGGLGTSMGCHGPKSVIPVRSDLSFLDLTVQQIQYLNKKYGTNVPLVLMNSFNTDEDTQKIIKKYSGFQVEIYTFCQSCYPRIYKDTYLPVPKRCDPSIEPDGWYPPGHGDFYASLDNSGLLEKFIAAGREYCFLSNIDNLGATVDLNILDMLIKENLKVNNEEGKSTEFVMEVTDKTKADVKGGTLIFYEDKLRLLEIAQVPKEHTDDFKSVKSFKFFNTNNLWIKLASIKRVLQKAALNMEIIVNPKQLPNNAHVIQLETAVGAAMKSFNGAMGINVPRSRFLPVKKTSDLMLVMSNLYDMHHGFLTMSPLRMFPTTPLVKLGDNHFSKVQEFLARFPAIPDMLELDHLTVSGDVTFGKGVVIKGTVIIIANHGDRIDIPAGSVLENKIVSGNLRILDH